MRHPMRTTEESTGGVETPAALENAAIEFPAMRLERLAPYAAGHLCLATAWQQSDCPTRPMCARMPT